MAGPWKAAFAAQFEELRRRLLSEEVERREASAPAAPDALRELAERLDLMFFVTIKGRPPLRLRGAGALAYFPSSVTLRVPPGSIPSPPLAFSSIQHIQIRVRSGRLMRSACLVSMNKKELAADARAVWAAAEGTWPLHFLEARVEPRRSRPGGGGINSLLFGTVAEEMGMAAAGLERPFEREQVALIAASWHLRDVVGAFHEAWGAPQGPVAALRGAHGDGSHCLSVALHTWKALLWQCCPGRAQGATAARAGGRPAGREGSARWCEELAGPPKLAWRTALFSGEVPRAAFVDFSLTDARGLHVYGSRAVEFAPLPPEDCQAPCLRQAGPHRLLQAAVEAGDGRVVLELDISVPDGADAGDDAREGGRMLGLRVRTAAPLASE